VTTIHLVRHGTHGLLAHTLAGRMPGVRLSEAGQEQSRALAARLAERSTIAAVYSSPLERCVETAAPIAARLDLEVQVAEALIELDFGDWTGRTFESIKGDPLWPLFNTSRSLTRPPNGELMREAQARIVSFIDELRGRHGDEAAIVLVSHGDVIRSALLHYLGMPLDFWLRIEVGPASISTVEVRPWGPRVVRLNEPAGGG
jgi:ribonuclease H / adenosylcobalamin/alpha-ribazole phosphatase